MNPVGGGRGVRAPPGPVDETGREAHGERLPLPDGRLSGLVRRRRQRQRLPVSGVPAHQLPDVPGHPRGRRLPPVPGPRRPRRRLQRGRQTDPAHDPSRSPRPPTPSIVPFFSLPVTAVSNDLRNKGRFENRQLYDLFLGCQRHLLTAP